MIGAPAHTAAGAGRGGGVAGTFDRRSRRPRGAAAAIAAAVAAAGTLLLSGCESPDILRSEGSAGNEIVTLAIWIFAILAIVLFTVWGLLVFVILRGRRRGESEASQTEGNLRIEATRSLKLNRDELTLTLTGLVRPDDITPDNTVASTHIADVQIAWTGRGPIPEKQRPGLLSALLSLLW